MIKSMTGFGMATESNSKYKVSIEIKSVNSKFLELNIKLPKGYSEKEIFIRSELSRLTDRGKMSALINVESLGSEKNLLNIELAKTYYQQIKKLSEDLGEKNTDILALCLQMNDVTKGPDDSVTEEEWNIVHSTLIKAIGNFNNFRDQEGGTLQKEIVARIQNILDLLIEVEKYENSRIEMVRTKLSQFIESAVGPENVDTNRLEQELIYYIEKYDITEEKVRLKTHCDYFQSEILKKETGGKKLGFISQEIGREINTLGSKANHSEIQKIVVNMKDELEKIKEQLLNVL